MTDETDVDFEEEARSLGWFPKEDFRGDPEKWVSAKEYVARGKQLMPLLKKNNERLESQVQQLTSALIALKGELESTKTGTKELQEFYEEQLVERVAQERERLKAQLKQARADENIDEEVRITEEIAQLGAAQKGVTDRVNGKEVVDTKEEQQPQFSQEFLEWKGSNEWFESDPERRFEAMQVAEKIQFDVARGRISPLVGRSFFAELDKRLNSAKRPAGPGKVEGTRGGVTSTTSNGRSYSDLPADAKAICDQEAKRFVKPNGLWKTVADYRKHYVEVLERTGYFNQ